MAILEIIIIQFFFLNNLNLFLAAGNLFVHFKL